MDSKPKVIVQLPNNPGDVLMAMQAIQASWVEAIEEGQIECHFIVDEECSNLVVDSPLFTKVYIQPRSFVAKAWQNSSHSLCSNIIHNFISEITQVHYDLAVNLYQGASGPVIHELLHADVKRGARYSREANSVVQDSWSTYLHAIPANRAANEFHTVDIYRRILRPSLFEQNALPSSCPVKLKLGPYPKFDWPRPYIAIQVGSAWTGKKWREDKWIGLCNLIQHHFEIDMIFIGAPQEEQESEFIISRTKNAYNYCGKTSLIGVAGILENAKFLICPDTFAMHMAASVGCSVFSIFGPSNPIETGPWGINHFVFNTSNPKAESFDFLDIQNINQIQAEFVFEAVQRYWENPEFNIDDMSQKENFYLMKSHWDETQSKIYYQSQNSAHQTHSPVFNLLAPDCKSLSSEAITQMQNQLQLLNQMIHTGEWQADFKTLEENEGKISLLTHSNITMESYRIELNSISLRAGIESYFQARKRLLERSLRIIRS